MVRTATCSVHFGVRRAALLLACAVLLGAGPARAAANAEVRKYLNAATTMFENLEYEKALKQLEKAKKKSQGPDDDGPIALLEGVVLADMGREEKALTSFKTALSMDPRARLPFEVSPKVEKTFARAQKSVEKLLAPMLAREEEERKRREDEARKADEERKAEDARRAEEARRAEQERLARAGPPPAPPAVQAEASSPGVRRYAWIPAVGGVALAGVGTIFLVQARGAYDALANGTVTPESAQGVRDTGKSQQMVGWIFVGAGGAAVAAAGAMLIFGGPSGGAPSATLAPLPGGAALVLSGPLP